MEQYDLGLKTCDDILDEIIELLEEVKEHNRRFTLLGIYTGSHEARRRVRKLIVLHKKYLKASVQAEKDLKTYQ